MKRQRATDNGNRQSNIGLKKKAHVEQDIRPHQPEVPPMRAIVNVEARAQELVRRRTRAVRARACRVGIRNIPTRRSDKGVEVFATRLARGRDDRDVLD